MTKPKKANPMLGVIKKKDRNTGISIAVSDYRAEIHFIEPSEILPYHNQARRSFDESGLSELADSIQSQGIIQPLQLVHSKEKPGKYEVVSGERRLRAAKMVGLEKVPAIILDQSKDSDVIALIENIQREDLHPIELGDAYSLLLSKNKGMKKSELATKLGISPQSLSDYLIISELPEEVKTHFLDNREGTLASLRVLARKNNPEEIIKSIHGEQSPVPKEKLLLKVTKRGADFKISFANAKNLAPDEKEELRAELHKIADYI